MGLPKNKWRKKLDFLAFFYLPPPLAHPLFLKILWHFRALYAAPPPPPWFLGSRARPATHPSPTLPGGPGPVLGESPSLCLGSWPSSLGWWSQWARGWGWAHSESPEEALQPVPSPDTGWEPQPVPGSCECSCVAAPPGMCHRPKCSKEISHAGGPRGANLVLHFASNYTKSSKIRTPCGPGGKGQAVSPWNHGISR